MKRIRNAFVTGILVLAPLVVTIHIFVWLVNSVDRTTRTYFFTKFFPFDFAGLGLILAIGIVLLVGALTQNFIGDWFVRVFDSFMRRIPLGGGIYSGVKKFLETIFNPSNQQFTGVVLVPFPRTGLYSIGFRTGTPDPKILKAARKKMVNVFVPCTPNPTSGFYLLAEESELIALDMTVQEAFKVVISMGIVTSDSSDAAP